MSDTQFKATLEMLIPLVIREIMKNRNVSEQEVFDLFYSSFLYSKLEVETTKLWHLSQLTLANLLDEEDIDLLIADIGKGAPNPIATIK